METMSWTDERLDNFAAETGRRFDSMEVRVDERFDAVDRRFEEVDRRFDGVDRRLDVIDRRLDRFEDRMDDLGRTIHRTMLQLGGGMIATLAIGLIGVIVTNG
jgi:hypothetical protein